MAVMPLRGIPIAMLAALAIVATSTPVEPPGPLGQGARASAGGSNEWDFPPRTVTFDPAAVRAAVLAGGPLTLPTYWGNATLTSFENAAGPSRVLDENGTVERIHTSSVWSMRDGNGTAWGTILADETYLSYNLRTHEGTTGVEPPEDARRGDETITSYVMYGYEATGPFRPPPG
jgi:hypothetical protein